MILRKHSNLELHRTTLSVRQITKIHRATADFKASGIERQALKIGDRAPKSGSRAGGLERSSARRAIGGQLFPGTLVTLLQHGAEGSTRNQF
jgi:hypothetical protein